MSERIKEKKVQRTIGEKYEEKDEEMNKKEKRMSTWMKRRKG